MNKFFSKKITILNFIFTIIICVYHFPLWKFGNTVLFTTLREGVARVAMASFFLISGYLLYQNATDYEDAKRKVKKRAISLLIPYLIWNIVAVIINVIVEKNFYFSFQSLIKIFLTGPANGAIWYLLAVYLLSLFAPLVVKYKHKQKTILIIFLSIVTYLFLKYIQIIPTIFFAEDLWWYNNALTYLPLYLIGCYAGLYFKDFLNEGKYWLIISIVSCLVFFGSIGIQYFTNIIHLHYFTSILIPVSFFLLIPNFAFRWKLNALTSNSFFIYMMHIPILIPLAEMIVKLIFKYPKNTTMHILLVALVAAVIMYIIATLIVIILKIILFKFDRLFGLLSGNRVKNDFSAFIKNKQHLKQQLKINNQTIDDNKNENKQSK